MNSKFKTFKFLFLFVIVFLFFLEIFAFIAIHYFYKINSEGYKKQIIQPQIYVNHPYYGYVFKPNSIIFQKTNIRTNSLGFADSNSNYIKEKDTCYIGIFGGSAAMSWGVENDYFKIHKILENNFKIKKDKSIKKCNNFKVRTFGVSSHHLTQSVNIASDFINFIDYFIFYIGNNECSHSEISSHRLVPVNFPEFTENQINLIHTDLVSKINNFKNLINRIDNFQNQIPVLNYSYFIKLFYDITYKFINNKIINLEINYNKISSSNISSENILGFDKIEPFISDDFLYNDSLLSYKILNKNFNVLFELPIEKINSFINSKNKKLLIVIQPLYSQYYQNNNIISEVPILKFPMYQKICYSNFLSKLQSNLIFKNIEILDLNNERFINSVISKNSDLNLLFQDNVHTTEYFNSLISNEIYYTIIKKL